MATSDTFKDDIEYSRIHEFFSRGRIEQERLWVAEKVVPKLIEKFKAKSESSVFEVLAVGSGIGSVDVMLLEELLRAKDVTGELVKLKIRWTVVEPLLSAIEHFKSTLDERAKDFGNVEFVWVNKSIGEIEDQLLLKGAKFDFIHFVNVFYYVNEVKALLELSYDLLKTPGVIFAVVGSEVDIWMKFIESFKHRVDSLSKQLNYLTNMKVFQNVEANGWDVELFDGKFDLEVTEMFIEGHPNGKALLKFFLHTNEDPQKFVGQELYTELIDFFKEQSWEDSSSKSFVKDDEGVLLIFK